LQDVPITNWAIIIGLVLIGTFIVIRFRKLV
jgi:LPXTG-motif cell wall-anchored protein